jgi:hypothetical protein
MVAIMSAAFEHVCKVLEPTEERIAATDLVAMKVVELARAGERDVGALTAKVLKIFGVREF